MSDLQVFKINSVTTKTRMWSSSYSLLDYINLWVRKH